MKNLQIIIGNEIHTSNQTTNLVIALHFECDGTCFPDNQWTDFADVLNMWSCTLFEHMEKSEANFTLYFMDGPFRLDVEKNKDTKLTIRCINFRKEEVIEFTINCDFVDLLLALYNAIKKISKMMFDYKMHQGKTEPVYRQFILTGKKLKNAIDNF
jgi:hypothetical protein